MSQIIKLRVNSAQIWAKIQEKETDAASFNTEKRAELKASVTTAVYLLDCALLQVLLQCFPDEKFPLFELHLRVFLHNEFQDRLVRDP